MSMAPCWDMKGCSQSDREQCDAYDTSLEPCWAVKRKGPFCQDEDCSTCTVYGEITTCHNIKSFLKQHWKNQ
jgi:MerR family transcriptional regulator/heat shock protein HspR